MKNVIYLFLIISINSSANSRIESINSDIEQLKQSNKIYMQEMKKLKKILAQQSQNYKILKNKYIELNLKFEENKMSQNVIINKYRLLQHREKESKETILTLNKKVQRAAEERAKNELYPIEVVRTVTKEIGCKSIEKFPPLIQR